MKKRFFAWKTGRGLTPSFWGDRIAPQLKIVMQPLKNGGHYRAIYYTRPCLAFPFFIRLFHCSNVFLFDCSIVFPCFLTSMFPVRYSYFAG